MTLHQGKHALRILGVLLLGTLASAPFRAQSREDEVQQTVARISFLSGSVSYARGDDPDNWQPADFNVPMTIGDRLYTDERSRAELQVHGGFYIRIGSQADLAALNLTDDTKQWSLRGGSAAFRVRRLEDNEIFEVDTPNAAVTFERAGEYRVDVDPNGNTRVAVSRGRALVASGGGQVPLNAGDEMFIEGIDSPRYDVAALRPPDAFDGWVRDRDRRSEGSRSRQYVHADIVGVADLDDHGRWQSIPQYGNSWTPSGVDAGWQPYRLGHWMWQDPWGWSWVGSESWGWAPYHYGRWIQYSSRWWWVPVAPTVRYVRYAPALVAFAGGGPGWSASVTVGGGGYVGWFPLAPRDPFVHWWGPRAGYGSSRNVTYVNHTYITVVNQNTFVSGGAVTTNWVRDRSVVTSVAQAPVLRGPLPFVPESGALHAAVRQGLPAPARPPQVSFTRAVVVNSAPPPPPPSFRAKVEVIRRDRGAPVAQEAAVKMVETDRSAATQINTVRPVAVESGRMTLAPKKEGGKAPKPEPIAVAPARGRQPSGGGSTFVAQPTAPPQPSSGGTVATAVPEPPRYPTQSRQMRPTPVIVPETGAPAGQPERGRRPETVNPRPTLPPAPEPTRKQVESQDRSRENVDRQHQGRPSDVNRPTFVPRPTMAPPPTAAPRPTPAQVNEERGRRENSQGRGQPPPTAAPAGEAPKHPAVERGGGPPPRATPAEKAPKPTPTKKPKAD
jgi:hypothetical protein